MVSDPTPTNLDGDTTDPGDGAELPDHLLDKLRINVPGYQVLNRMAPGGQGTVYRARELTSGLTVAIKVLNGGVHAAPAARQRMARETAALRALDHPNIVCVIEAGRTPLGLDFIVMNFVDGRPLDAVWTDLSFSAAVAPEPPARLRLFKRICDVVQAAHLKGITHRDLSPSNILVTPDGQPHILDFGLASTAFDDLLAPGGRDVTAAGQFVGKLEYASPEQARGDRGAVDVRTDVYALGVILYRLLTDGAFPYAVVGSALDVLNNIAHARPLPPTDRLRDALVAVAAGRSGDRRAVNQAIEAVVLKALEKDPADRYQSAGELAADIDQYLAGRPTAAVTRRRAPPTASTPQNRKMIAVLATTSVVILTGAVMNARTILHLFGLSTAAVALGAGPGAPANVNRPSPPRAGLHAPAPRVRPGLGAAPRPQFRVGDHTVKVNPGEPGVRAVRSMPPQKFDPAVRGRSVHDFYSKQPVAKGAAQATPETTKAVGPFRREFVWWTYGWGLRDRAWWAWNNYAYFDTAMWAQWMLDREFAAAIAGFDAAHAQRTPGFIPDQYAATPAEAVYSDEYIEAVYNPVYTTPSIVVDGSAGGRVGNLVEGVPRTFGIQNQAIGSVDPHAVGLQFVSIPSGFDPTYQIEVKRDGDLFIFGPRRTPLSDGLGTDAVNWHPVRSLVAGPGIDVAYQRHVAAGEKIRLHGVEWSIASEQIELFAPASREAQAAVRHVVGDLERMAANKGEFVQANPSLADYVAEAHDAAVRLVTTPNNNVNADAVDDCHYELANLRKMAEADLGEANDPKLAMAGKDLIRRIKSLEDSLNQVETSSGVGDAVDPHNGDNAGTGLAGAWSVHNKSTGSEATELFDPDGSCTSQMKDQANVQGKWTVNGEAIEVNWDNGVRQVYKASHDGRVMSGTGYNHGHAYILEATKADDEGSTAQTVRSSGAGMSKAIIGKWEFWNVKGWTALVEFSADGRCSTGPAGGTGTRIAGRWTSNDDSIDVAWENGVTNKWRSGGQSDEMSFSHTQDGVESWIVARRPGAAAAQR